MPQTLPDLPFAKDALAPHVSAETLSFHHGKHHKAYVDNLNKFLAGHALADATPDEIVRRIGEVDASMRQKVLNNALQHVNHSLCWKSMRPVSTQRPAGAFLAAIQKSFGSFDAMVQQFTAAGVGHFGSGWAWLVKNADGSLAVTSTHDAATPSQSGQKPLLTCDVWEHAYYIDYRNDRARYIESFWHLANWEFAEKSFAH